MCTHGSRTTFSYHFSPRTEPGLSHSPDPALFSQSLFHFLSEFLRLELGNSLANLLFVPFCFSLSQSGRFAQSFSSNSINILCHFEFPVPFLLLSSLLLPLLSSLFLLSPPHRLVLNSVCLLQPPWSQCHSHATAGTQQEHCWSPQAQCQHPYGSSQPPTSSDQALQ